MSSYIIDWLNGKKFWENWDKGSADVEFFFGKTVKNDLYNKIERYGKIEQMEKIFWKKWEKRSVEARGWRLLALKNCAMVILAGLNSWQSLGDIYELVNHYWISIVTLE